MTVNLVEVDPCPPIFYQNEPLRLSLSALKRKLEGILAAERFSFNDMCEARLTFTPDPKHNDDHCCFCQAVLISRMGRKYEYTVDLHGPKRRTWRIVD
jgi:hypothetical protein